MLLLELAAQGLKAVSLPGGGLRLRPGYDVVGADGQALRRLLGSLLCPAASDAVTLGAASSGARAGLTFLADDGATYRLLRDYGRALQLQRLDPQRRAFAVVGQAAPDRAAALLASAGGPAQALLELLSLSSAELPSRRRAGGAGAPLPATGPATITAGVRRRPDAAQQAARRQELQAELARARGAEELQERLSGLHNQLFQAEDALREEVRLREASAAARAELEAAQPLDAAAAGLGDVEAALGRYGGVEARLQEVLERCEAEAAALDEARPPVGFWRLPRFWAGVAASAVAVGVAVAFADGGGGLRYLALLDVPLLGWSAQVAMGWVRASEEHGRLGRRRQLLEEHERKAREGFARETAPVRSAVAALGLAKVGELREAVAQLAGLRARAAQAEEALAEYVGRPEALAAREEKNRLEGEVRELEGRLAAAVGNWGRDPRTVEAELASLEAEADQRSRPAEPPAVRVSAAEVLVEPATEGAALDPIRACLEAAAAQLGGSAAAAAREVQVRASQLLQAFSAGRLGGLSVDDRGNPLLVASGRPSPVVSASPLDRDLVWLALKLAFVERLLPRRFALVDDALAVIPEGARQQAARALKQVARPGQLIHATIDPAFRAAADHLA